MHVRNFDLGLKYTTLTKITFVVAYIIFKVAVKTSPLAKITFVVAEITCKIAVITSSVVVVVNLCFTSLFGTKGLLSDIIIR